jgi:hypothetical protein
VEISSLCELGVSRSFAEVPGEGIEFVVLHRENLDLSDCINRLAKKSVSGGLKAFDETRCVVLTSDSAS